MRDPRTLLSYMSTKSMLAKTFLSYSFALAMLLAVASLTSGCATGYQAASSGKTFDDLVAPSGSSDSGGSY